jgi:hypothetical protein
MNGVVRFHGNDVSVPDPNLEDTLVEAVETARSIPDDVVSPTVLGDVPGHGSFLLLSSFR